MSTSERTQKQINGWATVYQRRGYSEKAALEKATKIVEAASKRPHTHRTAKPGTARIMIGGGP